MASQSPWTDAMTEYCSDCGVETPHRVTVELRTESTKPENSAFSREPYRVTKCHACGASQSTRMNDA